MMEREYMSGASDLTGAPGSPWLVADTIEFPPLSGDLDADVIVVGAGLVGGLVAAELATRGMSVAVVERGRIACGTTGHSTAKITAIHGTDWSRVTRVRGAGDAVREWARRNQVAAQAIGEIVTGLGIECRFRMVDGYLCERAGSTDDALATEWQAMRAVGLPVEDAEAMDDSPFGGVVALRLRNQAQFDPAAFTTGLFGTLPSGRAVIHEHTAVRSLSHEDGMWVAYTDGGQVRGPLVVMTSLAPVRDPALLFARAFPYAHYAVEAAPSGQVRDGLWIQAAGSELTARPTDEPDGKWIMSGQSERLASTADERELYRQLMNDVEAEVGEVEVERYWSAEDFSTADGLPFVGRLGPIDGLYYIGGFGGWGMTKSVVAASLVADDIDGIAPTALMRLLSPGRFPRSGAWPALMRGNLHTAKHLAFPMPAQLHATAPAPPIVPGPGSETPRCTHMGCRTKVNTVEGTIDCPCHGSRFSAEGRPIYGPARSDAFAVQAPVTHS